VATLVLFLVVVHDGVGHCSRTTSAGSLGASWRLPAVVVPDAVSGAIAAGVGAIAGAAVFGHFVAVVGVVRVAGVVGVSAAASGRRHLVTVGHGGEVDDGGGGRGDAGALSGARLTHLKCAFSVAKFVHIPAVAEGVECGRRGPASDDEREENALRLAPPPPSPSPFA